MLLPQKRWFRIAEVAKRWSIPPSDIEDYALDEMLQLAVFVVGIAAEAGTWEPCGDSFSAIPGDLPILNGPQPLDRRSLLEILREGHPAGIGEKIICLKNRHDLGLVNGMFVSLADIRDDGRLAFSATVTTEDGVAIVGRQRFYKGHYDDHVAFDNERSRRDWKEVRGLIETVWGYAITCHKSQGTSWPNVIVYDDGLSRTAEDRNRWLYTAITRAERGLVILD